MANCLCRKNHMPSEIYLVYAGPREAGGGGGVLTALRPKRRPKTVNRNRQRRARVAPRARGPARPRRGRRSDEPTRAAAGALTGARYGVGMAYARNVRVKETHSIASQLIDTVCITSICAFVSDYRVAQWCGPSRAAAAERGGANHGNALAMGIRRIERDPCDAPKGSHKIVAAWPHRAPQRPTAHSDLLLPKFQRGTRSLYPSTPSGTARL